MLTIEGLAERPEFARLEEAFTRHAALQCGFCTPGMLLTVAALLETGELDERGGGQAQPRRQPLPLHRLPRHRRGRLPSWPGWRHERRSSPRRPDGAVGRSVAAPRRREKLRGQAQFAGDIVVPRMRTARCCARPVAHARIVSIDASEAERMAGVVCVLTARRPRTTSTRTRVTRSRTGRSWPSIASASRGEPVAAVAAEDEATALAALERIHVEYEELAVVGTVEQALADDAPLLHDGPLRPGLFHGLGELKPRRRQRLLPLPHRPRGDRGGLRPRRARGRRRVHVPRRLPVRDGDAHGRRPGRGRRDHALGVVPAPLPRARRDRRPVPGADRQRPHHRPLPRRRLRLEVVHEDGAGHRRARAEGGAPGADPEPRRRVDGDDAPPRHALPHADGG